MDEQGLVGQCLWLARLGQIQRVQPLSGGAELDHDAADGLREASVLVLGVDDEHLDALVERSKDLELGEVALAGARAGQDDLVVVLQGESIDEDEPSVVAFRPRKIPPLDSSSALANGNAAASAFVSKVRRSRSASMPRGSVSQP